MPVTEVRVPPPRKPDDVPLRIYSNPICPFAQRARLIAEHKKVKYEVIEVHLKNKPKWFLEKINPYGMVPVIEHDNHIIRESAIAFEYIDEVFGDKLWPTDPFKRAQSQLILNDFGNQFIPHFYKYYLNGEPDNSVILKFFQSVEAVITENGGPFIIGSQVSAIDLLIWPWIERLRAVVDIIPGISDVYSVDKIPLIMKWVDAMLAVEAVKNLLLPIDAYQNFYTKSKESGFKVHDFSMFTNFDTIYCTED